MLAVREGKSKGEISLCEIFPCYHFTCPTTGKQEIASNRVLPQGRAESTLVETTTLAGSASDGSVRVGAGTGVCLQFLLYRSSSVCCPESISKKTVGEPHTSTIRLPHGHVGRNLARGFYGTRRTLAKTESSSANWQDHANEFHNFGGGGGS